MKFSVTSYNAVAVWKWDTHANSSDHKLYHYAKNNTADSGAYDSDDDDDDDEEDDVCGICRLAFESTCPDCKIPGDDCPLIWGECTHVFHMHCLLKWIDTESSKGQCPMDRRPWATADRAPDQLPTTTTGEPVATVTPGPPTGFEDEPAAAIASWGAGNPDRRASVRFAPPDQADEDEMSDWVGSDGENPDGMDVDDPHPSSLRI